MVVLVRWRRYCNYKWNKHQNIYITLYTTPSWQYFKKISLQSNGGCNKMWWQAKFGHDSLNESKKLESDYMKRDYVHIECPGKFPGNSRNLIVMVSIHMESSYRAKKLKDIFMSFRPVNSVNHSIMAMQVGVSGTEQFFRDVYVSIWLYSQGRANFKNWRSKSGCKYRVAASSNFRRELLAMRAGRHGKS